MKANQIQCYFDQNLTRRIGEGSVEKMASKWEEGEDISNLLVKHQVWCHRKKRCILKIIMSEGGIEKDSAKNEGTDGCYRQVQVVFQLQGAC